MAFNFPASPSVGQTYPAMPVAGVPTYTWDGEKWMGATAGPANAPPLMDGVAAVGVSVLYTRQDHIHPSDTSRVVKAGDTMTGQLGLPTGAAAAQAVRKDYVDAGVAAATAASNNKLPLAGGQMTGVINTADSGGAIGGPNPSTAMVVHGVSGSAAYITFLSDGAFGGHFGLYPDGNFYIGGFSYGAVNYKVWTSRDFTTPVSNGRLAFAADVTITPSGMIEPYNGAVITGADFSGALLVFRWRYMQLFTTGWFTCGYA